MATQIMVPVNTFSDHDVSAVASHAARLAERLQGEVEIVLLAPKFLAPRSALGNALIDVPGMARELTDRCERRGAAVFTAVEEALGALGRTPHRRQVSCYPSAFAQEVAAEARYADIVLLMLARDDTEGRSLVEAVAFGSGRPTLVVPEGAAGTSASTIVVAWDGSRAAARALGDSAPLLRDAERVSVVTVVGEKPLPGQRPAQRLADYLGKHGIKAEAVEVPNQGDPAKTLQDHCIEVGADLLVMGAFGHSRLREFVLGGVTVGILADLRLPVLLSH